MNIPFIKYSKLWVGISASVAVICLVLVVVLGLKPGIDFTGGSLLETSFSTTRPTVVEMQQYLAEKNLNNAVVQPIGENSLAIRTGFLNEEEHQKLLSDIRGKYANESNTVKEERFETIGASVSQQLRQRALWAILLVSLGIIAYVAYAFRKVSRPVASWKYGLLAVIALIHDLLLVMGVFAVLGHFRGVEVDTAFVVALLTVLGYSVNDTIVVFDRVRENLLRHRSDNFAETVNIGLNQTLMRSLNTTLTTLFPLFTLFFFGGSTIHNFVLALLIGIASGVYSSIFIASPLLVLVEKWQRKNA